MKCPHCLKEFHPAEDEIDLGRDRDGFWSIKRNTCPACDRFILVLEKQTEVRAPAGQAQFRVEHQLFRPKGALRPPPPQEVPEKFAADYREACLVLPDSPQASAALSRRCLQHLLRVIAKVKPGNLATEIGEFLAKGGLPQYIAETIDAIRHIGNFAAHPLKSQSSGEIIPVEAGEAEWNLNVLEALFDFFFVQPEAIKRKRDALNAKLKEAGKPPMK